MEVVLGIIGRITLNIIYNICTVCVLICDTFRWMIIEPLRGKGLRVKASVEQFVEFGVHSLPIVALICFLVGAIMAMQASYQLARFGASIYIANLVGVAAMRELAPLMTAILLAGRSGSAIAAEIGTMKVSEEIDALKVAGINPIKFLVVPKFLGMLFAVPCVTILGIFIMIMGGFFLATFVLGLDPNMYLDQTANALVGRDLLTGMVKSVFFAIVICWVGIYRGFRVQGGAEGVGKQTTASVVISIVFIIWVDLIFTALFYFV